MKNWKKFLGTGVLASIVLPMHLQAITFDELYQQIAPEGKMTINSVKPKSDTTETESFIISHLQKYQTDDIELYGYCDNDNVENCHINMTKFEGETVLDSKNYDVLVKYSNEKYNEKVAQKIDEMAKKFPSYGNGGEQSLFLIEDLEIINYILAGGYSTKEFNIDIANSVINYSGQLKKLLNNTNIIVQLNIRAGWDDMFSSGGFGDLLLTYNDYIYTMIDTGGVRGTKVIYVDDSTENTREALIAAAQKRLDNYVGEDKLTISYKGQISDLNDDMWIIALDELIDVSKTNGEYYSIEINGEDHNFFIVRDSSKMIENPTIETTDVITNVIIKSSDYNIPLDSNVRSVKLNEDTEEFKNIMKKLQLETGIVFDLSVFSKSTNMYISRLDNGNFKVYIPIDDSWNGNELLAYYITDDGSIEKHPVKIENGYAIFETNHFSTYTIGVANEANIDSIPNPSTGDNVVFWSLMGMVATFGIIGISLYKKKYFC